MGKKILLTGGLGYIGSHTAVELFHAGFQPILLDNLSNSKVEVLDRIGEIIEQPLHFYLGDVRDGEILRQIFSEHQIEGVIHFAALKSVSESVQQPLKYFDVNVGGLTQLLQVMQESNVKKLVFSSSCTVYGQPTENWEVSENTPLQEPMSPYARTKRMNEEMIRDVCHTGCLSAVILRYFNPVGAHPSGLIGELPLGVPANLVPFLTQSVAGIRQPLTVFGNDYPTSDGTCIRDYIHVVDLAKAHVAALNFNSKDHSPEVFNVGTGKGSTVLEVISSFEKTTGLTVPFSIGPRREGDITAVYANTEKIQRELNWKSNYCLDDMMLHAWNWQKNQN
jgi:UDP-glucose 4-epimerase